jgi:succinylarginine dihydrolase
MATREYNFDGLVGPTHNYSGLSVGNLASKANRGVIANPRLAALQGLAKMRALADRGFAQAVLPPQERPSVATLRRLGFAGSDAGVLARAAKDAPAILSACLSASAMWTANAATVGASADTADARVHFTPANLGNKFHRCLEAPTTSRVLRAIFADESRFVHHEALPCTPAFGDEGAANHTRLAARHGEPGVQFFVYGASAFDAGAPAPVRFPARQTREASEAVARLHGLDMARTVFAQQRPATIDAGVFHNDVIAVGNANVLLCHAHAWLEQARVVERLRAAMGGALEVIEISEAEVTLAEAVETYLFNSQLLSNPDGSMVMVVPEECRRHDRVRACLDGLVARSGAVREWLSFDLRESMRNGGGPACLRLRVELSAQEAAAMNGTVVFTPALHERLIAWVGKHYRDRLGEADLADPRLLDESRRALDELSGMLALGSVYPFQRG